MRAVWCVFDNRGIPVAQFDHLSHAAAVEHAEALKREIGTEHFVAPDKVPMVPTDAESVELASPGVMPFHAEERHILSHAAAVEHAEALKREIGTEHFVAPDKVSMVPTDAESVELASPGVMPFHAEERPIWYRSLARLVLSWFGFR
jgi:hypothetical protein